VTDTLTLFLGGIAGISLAVGGIGVMNIMLTTVTERTHEIGLRSSPIHLNSFFSGLPVAPLGRKMCSRQVYLISVFWPEY